MRFVSRLFAVLFASGVGSAHADDVLSVERTALVETVERFDAAMRANDFPTVIGMVPEKVFAEMARRLKTTPDQLAEIVALQMEDVVTQVTIIEFKIATDDVSFDRTADEIVYAFLPTRTLIEMQDTKVETSSYTLALRAEEGWRLVRVDDAAQLKVLRQVYPGFVQVNFPKGTTKLVD